jgi:hypothetical protein
MDREKNRIHTSEKIKQTSKQKKMEQERGREL